MIKKITILIILLISTSIYAQNNRCNTTELMKILVEEDPQSLISIQQTALQNNEWVNKNRNTNKSVITIPIVVHIVHKQTHSNIGSGTNISNAQIEDALRILSEDFNKNNVEFPNPPRSTFLNLAADVQMQFCFAAIDENGNPTNGVTRTSTSKTNFDPEYEANDMKRNNTLGKDGWDPAKYLNIWICDLAPSSSGGMTLGYSYLPGLGSWNVWKDGLVVDYRYFGTIGVSAPGNDGSTATHEIGHYLGLYHTFCEQTNNNGNAICCDNDDNQFAGNINDTPASKDIYFGSVNSSTNNNTCNDISYPNSFNTNVLDMDENFMSYSSNVWMFTQDQSDVMNGTMNGYRNSLKNSSVSVNCSGTVGVNNIFNNKQIRIYPNPSEGNILIQNLTNYNSKRIIVRNIIGEIVLSNNTNRNLFSYNISSLENGIYFIEVITEQGKRIEKIILSQ